MILLTPGPCMTSESVRQAAAVPDMNHRDPAFIEILRDTKQRLLRVYDDTQTGWRPYLIGGSGTAAVEAMITSCVKSGPVLLIDSGYYSGRVRSKFEAHEIPFSIFEASIEEEIDFDALNRALGSGRFEALVTTHHETSTGRLHDIAKIGALCDRHGVKVLVDAMSSFGADAIDFTTLHAVSSSANKCLHGLPGASFVLVREDVAVSMPSVRARTVYLSLPLYEGDSPPLTPPVPILNALRQALLELGTGLAASRRAEYQRRANLLREGLENRGFQFLAPEGRMSCSLTTASIPAGWSADEWFQANLEAGFMIYMTKGELREKWFQVANMGEIAVEHLRLWLAAVDDLLTRERPQL